MQPNGRIRIEKTRKITRGHTLGAFCPDDESRSKLVEIEKNRSTCKDYLDRTTFLRPSVPSKDLKCLLRQPRGRFQAHLNSIPSTNG